MAAEIEIDGNARGGCHVLFEYEHVFYSVPKDVKQWDLCGQERADPKSIAENRNRGFFYMHYQTQKVR